MSSSARWATAAVAAILLTPAAATAAPRAQTSIVGANTNTAIADSYIAVLKPAVNVTARAQVLAERHAGRLDRVFDRVLHGFSVTMTAGHAAELANEPDVAYVAQDQTLTLAGEQPNPPSWGLDRIDQRYLPLDNRYRYEDAAVPATVVVIDSGIRISHQEFGGRAQHLFDFVDGEPDADDCTGHGTAVAAVIGGATFGVAKEVQLKSIRVADCAGIATVSRVLDALNLVPGLPVPRPALVNLSIQSSCTPDPSCAAPVNQAIRDVVASGYPVVVAAGNDHRNTCDAPIASVPEAITVGATTQDDARRADSNFGPCVDLWAPGTGITTAGNASDTATTTAAGTSIAAPHVTGVAAMMLSRGLDTTPPQVAAELNRTSTTLVVANLAGTESPNKMVSTSTEPLQGNRWGFVWANQPTVASYTPNTSFQGNSTGALNTVTRVGVGRYTVRFANLGDAVNPNSNGGNGVVNVGAYASLSHTCQLADWAFAGSNVEASVLCFTATGAPTDVIFTAAFTGTLNSTGDFGFVYANSASTPIGSPYTPALGNQFNSTGRTNTVVRVAPGRYEVRLPRLGGPVVGGSVRVAPVGTAPSTCIASDWSSANADLVVNVQCRDSANSQADALFTVTYARDTSTLGVIGGTGGYLLADNPFAATYTPSPAHQFNSAGDVNTVIRNGTGVYSVRMPRLGGDNGNVQVTAVGTGGERCNVASWGGATGRTLIATVFCFTAGNFAIDTKFTVSYTR